MAKMFKENAARLWRSVAAKWKFMQMGLTVAVPGDCQHLVYLYFQMFYLKGRKVSDRFFLRGEGIDIHACICIYLIYSCVMKHICVFVCILKTLLSLHSK